MLPEPQRAKARLAQGCRGPGRPNAAAASPSAAEPPPTTRCPPTLSPVQVRRFRTEKTDGLRDLAPCNWSTWSSASSKSGRSNGPDGDVRRDTSGLEVRVHSGRPRAR